MKRITQSLSKQIFRGVVLASVLVCFGCSVLTTDKGGPQFSPVKKASKQRTIDIDRAVSARVAAGSAYLESGDYERAHRHLDRALELDPNSSVAHGAIALLYRLEGDGEKEETHYQKAIKLDSNNSAAHNNYGSFLCGQNRFAEAEREFGLAAENFRYDRRSQSYENLGRCLSTQGNVEGAQKAFSNAYRLDKNLPRTLLALAVIYYDQGLNQQSYSLLTQYSEIAKANPESLWLGIRLERIFGDLDALASYEVALKNLYPGSNEYAQYTGSAVQGSTAP